MWIRLRRLTVIKNKEKGEMKATMRTKGSSVNALHPSMAEVQAIATHYAAHCAKAGSNNRSDGSTLPQRPVNKKSRRTRLTGAPSSAVNGAGGTINESIYDGSLANRSQSGSENRLRRGTKRTLPVLEATETRAGSAAPCSGRKSNLGVVRCSSAPNVFDTRVKIVAHFPLKVRGCRCIGAFLV